jgi:8-oxo-dGTP diphosphatase
MGWKLEGKAEMKLLGAKVALFIGPDLLVMRRDNRADIPWPNHIDLPGGGAEPGETAEACAIRETHEEFGLHLPSAAIVWRRSYLKPEGQVWFFAAALPAEAEGEIRFGTEGQGWWLMPPHDFVGHPEAVPQFRDRLREYLDASGR